MAQEADRSSAAGLAEIIVTAQRRGENIQDVPIAVSALSSDRLAAMGSSSSESLTLVPSVVYNPSAAGGGITIRGVSGTNSGSDEPGNAIYIDGVYQFAGSANLFQFNGIERIEVLKGPQGTLFGRNTAGGVVQVITRDPGDKPVVEAEVGYANYDTLSGKLYLSTPVTDTIGVNLSAFGIDQNDGWGRNFGTGNDFHKGYSWGVRAKAKWVAPSNATDVTLSAVYNKDRPVASAGGNLAAGVLTVLGTPTTGLFNGNSEIDQYRETEQYSFSGTIHQDVGFARLTSITALDHARNDVFLDADATPVPIFTAVLPAKYKVFTQELQLQSQSGSKLQWIIGGFYLHARTNIAPEFSSPFGSLRIPSEMTTRSLAAFGQATYPIFENTKITAGLRYTSDKRHVVAPTVGLDTSKTDNKPSWRLAIDHQFTPDVMVYASYSRGFKSGVFNPTDPAAAPAGPTSLDAFEIGLKSETFNRRVRFNAAAFYYDYKDFQSQLFSGITGFAYQANVSDARTYGLELDLVVEPVTGFTISGGISVLDAKFTGDRIGPAYEVEPTGGISIGQGPLNGKTLPFTPKFTGSIVADYRHETSIGTLAYSAAFSHNSGYYSDPSNFRPGRIKSFDLVNASIRWTSLNGSLNASVWAKNLLDKRYFASADIGAGPIGVTAYPAAPRTYGATVGVKF